VTQGIQLALLEWSRKAEFSADRAGLLAVQDRGAAYRALSKLMAPDKGLWREINHEDIMKQAREFEELEKDNINKTYKFLTTISSTHPWTIIRAKEINEWINEGDYDKVFSMDPNALQEVVAKTERLSSNKTLCPDSGHELVWIEQYQRWYCYGCNKYP